MMRKKLPVLIGVLALVLGMLTSCSDSDEAPLPSTKGSLDAALSVIPAGARSFTFGDQVAAKKRLGFEDVTAGTDVSSDRFREYLKAAADTAALGIFTMQATPKSDNSGWNFLDIEWQIDLNAKTPTHVLKLRDDLDFAKLSTSFAERGYQRSGTDARPVFNFDVSTGKRPFSTIFAVTLVPEKHLLVVGADSTSTLGVIDGTTPSLAGDELVSQLLNGVPTPEYLDVRLGQDACISASAAVGRLGSLDKTKAELQRLASLKLAPIDGRVTAINSDSKATVITHYPDAAAATADLVRRQGLLADGASLVNGTRYSTLFTVDGSSVTDRSIRYELTSLKTGSMLFVGLSTNLDEPWALCA